VSLKIPFKGFLVLSNFYIYAIMIIMTNKKENILGVDIGGSKINFVAWDGRKIIKQVLIQKPTIAKLKRGIEQFPEIKKIGFGAPGIVDAKTGKIIKCPNLPEFNGLNLKKLFPDNEIKIDNDVHCFLLAEKLIGQAKNKKNVLAVMMGTGIGGAIMINNKILPQPAGEVGRMIIDNGQTWEKLYQKNKNNPQKQKQIHKIAIANLINIFNPEIIILGGKGARSCRGLGLLQVSENTAAIGAALLFE